MYYLIDNRVWILKPYFFIINLETILEVSRNFLQIRVLNFFWEVLRNILNFSLNLTYCVLSQLYTQLIDF